MNMKFLFIVYLFRPYFSFPYLFFYLIRFVLFIHSFIRHMACLLLFQWYGMSGICEWEYDCAYDTSTSHKQKVKVQSDIYKCIWIQKRNPLHLYVLIRFAVCICFCFLLSAFSHFWFSFGFFFCTVFWMKSLSCWGHMFHRLLCRSHCLDLHSFSWLLTCFFFSINTASVWIYVVQ